MGWLFWKKPKPKPETDEELEARRVAAWDRWNWETGDDGDLQESEECENKQLDRSVQKVMDGIIERMVGEQKDEYKREILKNVLKENRKSKE